MLKNRQHRVILENETQKEVRFNGSVYRKIETYEGFIIFVGKRFMGDKYKTGFIGIRYGSDLCLGSFSKKKGLIAEIDLFQKKVGE